MALNSVHMPYDAILPRCIIHRVYHTSLERKTNINLNTINFSGRARLSCARGRCAEPSCRSRRGPDSSHGKLQGSPRGRSGQFRDGAPGGRRRWHGNHERKRRTPRAATMRRTSSRANPILNLCSQFDNANHIHRENRFEEHRTGLTYPRWTLRER